MVRLWDKQVSWKIVWRWWGFIKRWIRTLRQRYLAHWVRGGGIWETDLQPSRVRYDVYKGDLKRYCINCTEDRVGESNEFCENVLTENGSPGVNYGFRRTLNAFNMSYSILPRKNVMMALIALSWSCQTTLAVCPLQSILSKIFVQNEQTMKVPSRM